MKYFARVELHHADSAAYDSLHERMLAISFYRLIVDTSPNNRHIPLPTGCYLGFRDEGMDAVFGLVRRTADSVTTLNKVYCARISDDRFIADF